MMYRRRSVEQSGWPLKSHVEDAPANAAEIQGELRAGDVSFIDRPRYFGGGVLRGTDSYSTDRSEDVAAYWADRPDALDDREKCAEFY